jgi:enediyne biosynthesis protein E4
VSLTGGPGITERVAGRGCAFGDFDNDGDIDVVVNTINDAPQLLRCDSTLKRNWIRVKCVGTKSNRSGIGARVTCRAPGLQPQTQEVRSGGSYLSQNDLRLHFGLNDAATADLEVRWPSGAVQTLTQIKVNEEIRIVEQSTAAP